MNGLCGPCLTIATLIQRERPQAQWAAAIAEIEDLHVQTCVQEYLAGMVLREATIKRMRSRHAQRFHP
jgi:hypothetical protein